MTYCLKRKNKKRFFSFQSMPNLNFAELILHLGTKYLIAPDIFHFTTFTPLEARKEKALTGFTNGVRHS